MKTLYLHIGTPKTGTTSIQMLLCDNRALLNDYGYCYPRFPMKYDRLGKTRNGLFLQQMVFDKSGKLDLETERQNFQKGMEILREQFQRFDHIILSDEVIWLSAYERRATLWEELLEEGERTGFQIKIIVYLRRQDQYISSWWNQMVKKRRTPLTMPWDEYRFHFPQRLQADYEQALSRIAAVIGRENIIVRVFEPKRFYQGSLEADFLHAVGLSLTSEYRIREELFNRNLAGNTHELKRILNTLPDIRAAEDDFFRDTVIDFAAQSKADYPVGVLSAEDAAEFMEPYLEGNRRIARDYFGEEDSLLFDMSFPDKPKWEKDNPYMINDVIRLAGSASRRLLRLHARQAEELESIKEKTDRLTEKLRDLEERSRALTERKHL